MRKNLNRIKEMGDPSAMPLFEPLNQFVDSCVTFLNYPPFPGPDAQANIHGRQKARQDVQSSINAVRHALEAIISDRDTLDKLLHQD